MVAADSEFVEIAAPETVIVDGSGIPGPRPELLVAEGDVVAPLQPLARRRRQPWQTLVSPVDGTVTRIIPGPRRSLKLIEIAPGTSSDGAASLDDLPTREDLVAAGLWHLIRSRPFDCIATPAAAPRAILVTAFFRDPLGPDPTEVMDEHDRAALERGLRAIAALDPCGVTLIHCGKDPTGGSTIPGLSRYHIRRQTARGLGALVRRFGPACPERPVWYTDWQGVAEIGRRIRNQTGPVRRFYTLRRTDGPVSVMRAVVGTPMSNVRHAVGVPDGHLIHGEPPLLREAKATGWETDRLSVLRTYPQAQRRQTKGPIIPLPALESALPQISAPALLLRALAAGDDETAVKLGAFDLGPEDVALCSYLCVSGNDYAALLARVSERLAEEWNSA